MYLENLQLARWILQGATILEVIIALWGLAAILVGSKLKNPWGCIPLYAIPRTAKTCRVSLLLFTSGIIYGIFALGVAFIQNSPILCDIFVRICVLMFVVISAFAYIFMIVKLKAAKIDRNEKSILERILMICIYLIPAFIPVGVYFLPGRLYDIPDFTWMNSSAQDMICVIDTKQWEIFAVFAFLDWSFNFGFFYLFLRCLQEVIMVHKNSTSEQAVQRAFALIRIAKRNFFACLICIIPSSILFGLMMLAAHSNLNNLLISAWAQVFVPITVASAMVSAIFSTRKGYRFKNDSQISSKDKANSPTPNADSSESKITKEKEKMKCQNLNVQVQIAS